METENSLKPGFPDEVVTPYPIQVGIAKEPSPNGDYEGAISVGRNGGNGDPSLPVGWKRVEVFTGWILIWRFSQCRKMMELFLLDGKTAGMRIPVFPYAGKGKLFPENGKMSL